VPPPAPALIAVYYARMLVVLWRDGRARLAAAAAWLLSALCIVIGIQIPAPGTPPGGVRLTMMDVGQAEALLLELPDRSSVAIDSGGAPFGGGAFDIGGRVLAPALWARGIRRVGALLITHADPDHIGGAAALLDAVPPGEVWTGVPVPASLPLAGLRAAATKEGIPWRQLRAGASWAAGPARVRVLHPPEPDWERPRVRNDDSVVLEVVQGDVALLLTGDISAATERQILPLLTPARVRVLKAAHHGSRTSTSAALIEQWRPQIALVSAGRGNRFGHPAPDVIARLRSLGTVVYRTDRHGQITVDSDGSSVTVRTFTGEEP
jgi:competence protein ComEC